MAVTNNQRIQRAIDLVAEGIGPFVDKQLMQRFGDDWPAAVNRDGTVPPSPRTDGYFLLKAMIHLWRDGGFGDVLGRVDQCVTATSLKRSVCWISRSQLSCRSATRMAPSLMARMRSGSPIRPAI